MKNKISKKVRNQLLGDTKERIESLVGHRRKAYDFRLSIDHMGQNKFSSVFKNFDTFSIKNKQ